jgi:hypothetical protein
VLLEPKSANEIGELRQRQRKLWSIFGGVPIEHVHLTCQRFARHDDNRVEVFASRLERILADIEPFPLTALSLETLYVPVRETHILKWQVQITGELRYFVAVVEDALHEAGLAPLYILGFISSLVAALRNINEPDAGRLASFDAFPHHLFTAERVVLSKIEGADRFEILASFDLGPQTLTDH